jgi:CheY-like chemotaxis protein
MTTIKRELQEIQAGENHRQLIILLVEDDENDILFVREATGLTGERHRIHAVHDGQEAVDYLQGKDGYADRGKFPFPDVIVTDLKMPRMDGFDLLTWLREHPECSLLPTLVLSSSQNREDVRKAYKLGANSYIVKPMMITVLRDTLRSVFDYWSRCERPQVTAGS